jgi:hypothetical protein
MVGWAGNLECITAMRIAEEKIKGTKLMNKCIVTALQKSRENSQQLPCFAMTEVLANT